MSGILLVKRSEDRCDAAGPVVADEVADEVEDIDAGMKEVNLVVARMALSRMLCCLVIVYKELRRLDILK